MLLGFFVCDGVCIKNVWRPTLHRMSGRIWQQWEFYQLLFIVGLFSTRTDYWPVVISLKAVWCADSFASCPSVLLKTRFWIFASSVKVSNFSTWNPRRLDQEKYPVLEKGQETATEPTYQSSLSAGAVKAVVLSSGANHGSFCSSEYRQGFLNQSKTTSHSAVAKFLHLVAGFRGEAFTDGVETSTLFLFA